MGQGVISKDLFSRHYLWPECKRDWEVAVDLMCVFKIYDDFEDAHEVHSRTQTTSVLIL